MLPVWLDGCWPHHEEGSSLGHCGRSDERCTFLLMQIKASLLSCQHAVSLSFFKFLKESMLHKHVNETFFCKGKKEIFFLL